MKTLLTNYIQLLMIKKYIKKPVKIEAVQYLGNNIEEIENFIDNTVLKYYLDGEVSIGIPTLEGIIKASVGDYIIKGVRGEFYPCPPDIFKLTYDEV